MRLRATVTLPAVNVAASPPVARIPEQPTSSTTLSRTTASRAPVRSIACASDRAHLHALDGEADGGGGGDAGVAAVADDEVAQRGVMHRRAAVDDGAGAYVSTARGAATPQAADERLGRVEVQPHRRRINVVLAGSVELGEKADAVQRAHGLQSRLGAPLYSTLTIGSASATLPSLA